MAETSPGVEEDYAALLPPFPPPSRAAFVPRGCCVNIAAGPRETRKPSNLETKVGNEPCNVPCFDARCHPPSPFYLLAGTFITVYSRSHFVDFDYLPCTPNCSCGVQSSVSRSRKRPRHVSLTRC